MSVKVNTSPSRPVFTWIVALLVPFVLVLTSVRVMFNPWFLQIEYNAPGFPEDRYGFSKEERLHWSRIALEYLYNDAGIEFLGDLRFEDGTAVYNQRELKHMIDAKAALQGALKVWYVTLGALLLLGVWAWRAGWTAAYRQGLVRGGWLTILFLLTILFFVLFGFGFFFVAFHNVFFASGTWMFEFSDTLIRLFPERLWRDGFIWVAGLSLAGALALAFGFRARK